MDELIGQTISHYTILEELGRGGMGVVYKARDLRLDRPVAMKFLPKKLLAGSEDRERLFHEARAASTLNHPGICTIHDIDEADGEPFLVMEYIEGMPLHEWIKNRARGEDRNHSSLVRDGVDIAIHIAEALGKAHEHGILHRDVKSDNIMVMSDGQVKIMDFGLATMTHTADQAPLTKHVVGTPQYMSPEQIENRPLDRRSDIFSLGVVLYELFTGVLPFAADYDLAVLYAILHSEPEPPDEANPDIPPGVSRIVLRCLRKQADDRYQSCADLVTELGMVRPLLEENRRTQAESVVPSLSLSASQSQRSVFIGREPQLRLIESRMQEVTAGAGRTVLIHGESGVGKSRLVDEAAAKAHQMGMSVLEGRCLYQEALLPYHPYVTALKRGVQNFDHHMVEMLARRAASRGIDLTGRLSLLKAFFGLGAEPATLLNKEQLWDAIVLLLRVLADRPIVLVIDDLQWADATTQGLFGFIARNIRELPVLQVGVYRDEDSLSGRRPDGPDLIDTLRQLRIEGLAEQVEIDRLTTAETGKAVVRLLDDKPVHKQLLERVYETTRGNPLFVFELVNLMRAQQAIRFDGEQWRLEADARTVAVPDRVQEVILRRIEKLGREEREILEIASCEGDSFQSDVIPVCLGIERLALLKRLQSLEQEHALIRHDRARYWFDHPLIRQILYESILFELRQEYHKKIAAWLLERHVTEDAYASRIAHHLVASGQEEESLGYLLRAADQASRLYAHDDAMRHYQKVREILDRSGGSHAGMRLCVEEGLGDVSHSSGKPQEALQHFDTLLDLARGASDRATEIKALRKSAENLRIIGDMTKALATCNEALSIASRLQAGHELVNCLNTLAVITMARAEYDRTIEVASEALVQARALADPRNESLSLCTLGSALVHRGEYRRAVERLEEARALQQSIGDTRGLATTFNYAGLAYHRLGELERAVGNHQEALKIKRSIGDQTAVPGSLNGLGDVFRDIGDIERAIDFHRQSLALAREQRNRGSECDNVRDLGADYLLKGDIATARKFLEEVLDLSRNYGYPWYEARSRITLAEVHFAAGEPEAADSSSEIGLNLARKLGARELVIEALRVRAKAVSRGGSYDDRARLLQEAIGIATSIEQSMFLWQLYGDLAALHAGERHESEARHARDACRGFLLVMAEAFHDQELRSTFLNRADVQDVLHSTE